MNNHVRHLDLRLSLPPELRSRSWAIAEQLRDGFISEVVERIAERLHAQFGADALIEVPLLEVQWGGKELVITDFDYARKLGDEVADELLSEFDTRNIDRVAIEPSSGDGLRVYRSQAHKAAIIVSARARQQQQSGTIANLAALEQEWQGLCEQGSASVAEGVCYICELGAAETVVESLSTMLLQVAVAVCPLIRWPQSIQSIVATRLLQAAQENSADREQEPQAERPATKPATGEREDIADKDAAAPPVTKEEIEQTTGQGIEPERTEKADTPQHTQHQSSPGDTIFESQTGVVRIEKGDRHTENSLTKSVVAEAANKEPVRQTTHYAGLVYMLNLIMRIDLPELLWCCGLDEGSFLFDLCRQLTGDEAEHDPVLTAISGIEADRSNYKPVAIPDWAWCEVVQKIHTRLQHLFPRASYYAFSDEDIKALAESSCDEETSWQHLVEAIAGLLAAAFLDLVCAAENQKIDPYLCQEGWIEVTVDNKKIVGLSMESIDIDVRRAGLDVNPGYLRWCRDWLRLSFIDDYTN